MAARKSLATTPTAKPLPLAAATPRAAAPPAQSPRRWLSAAWKLAALPLLLLFLVPVVLLLSRASPAMLLAQAARPLVYQALGLSLRTTLLSLALILLLGTPLAYWLGRYQFRYKKAVETLIDLPTVLPPSVAGIALLLAFGRRGPIGGWLEAQGIQIAFSTTAVIIAQVFIAAPFYVRAASLGFAAIDSEIVQAAQIDGANRWQALRYIILPLASPALLSGGVMSWARAMGEFGATILFAGNFPGRTQTMPLAIYLGFEQDFDSALTLSVLLILAASFSLLVTRLLIARQAD